MRPGEGLDIIRRRCFLPSPSSTDKRGHVLTPVKHRRGNLPLHVLCDDPNGVQVRELCICEQGLGARIRGREGGRKAHKTGDVTSKWLRLAFTFLFIQLTSTPPSPNRPCQSPALSLSLRSPIHHRPSQEFLPPPTPLPLSLTCEPGQEEEVSVLLREAPHTSSMRDSKGRLPLAVLCSHSSSYNSCRYASWVQTSIKSRHTIYNQGEALQGACMSRLMRRPSLQLFAMPALPCMPSQSSRCSTLNSWSRRSAKFSSLEAMGPASCAC